MSDAGGEGAQDTARVLADPHRYAIVRLLASHPEGLSCARIRAHISVARPTLSHHMRELRDAGLTDELREGRTVHYTLRRDALLASLEALRGDLLG